MRITIKKKLITGFLILFLTVSLSSAAEFQATGFNNSDTQPPPHPKETSDKAIALLRISSSPLPVADRL